MDLYCNDLPFIVEYCQSYIWSRDYVFPRVEVDVNRDRSFSAVHLASS